MNGRPAVLVVGFALVLTGCEFKWGTSASPAAWQRLEGAEGETWRADSGEWRAEVSRARGRLVYLGPIHGPNLLNHPPGPPDKLQFGGHRVWLGPQTEWKYMWPPPAIWEMRPAAGVALRPDGILEVVTPEKDDATPVLRRHYSWISRDVLQCRVVWRETNPKGRQAIQILQLAQPPGDPPTIEVSPRAEAEAGVPQGYLRMPLAARVTTETHFTQPSQVEVREGGKFWLRRNALEEKLAVPRQTITALWADYALQLHPGEFTGRDKGDPDAGYSSHVYLGPEAWPVLEIEQLSPRLVPQEAGGEVSYSIRMELRPRAGKIP